MNIPPEVLSQIFLFALPQHGFSLPQPESPQRLADFTRHLDPLRIQLHYQRCAQQSSSRTPLLFGTICRYWREVAYSTPMLWARLEVPVRDESIRRGLRMFKEWIPRSAGCPLAIYIGFAFPPADFQLLLDAISPHCDRLESLEVFAPVNALVRLAETIFRCEGGLPSLRSLRFTSNMGNGLSFDTPHLPKLAQLSLPGSFNLNFTDQIVQTNLRVLELDLPPSFPELFHHMRLFPCIEELFFCNRLHGSRLDTGVDLEMITLPRLRKLHMSSLTGRMAWMLDHLSLPSLNHLVYGPINPRYGVNSGEAFPSWSHLSAMLKRSNADLASLRFADRLLLPYHEVVACLQLSPNLKYLSGDDSLWTREIVGELISKGTFDDADDESSVPKKDLDPPSLVPLLEEFTVERWPQPPGADKHERYLSQLADLVSSRWKSGVGAGDEPFGPSSNSDTLRHRPTSMRANFLCEWDKHCRDRVQSHPVFQELIPLGLDVRYLNS